MSAPGSHLRFVLDHVAVGLDRVADAAPLVAGDLGARPHGAGPGAGFRFWQYAFAGGGVLELLEPDGAPGGFLHRFLERRGPGVHHVTFKVRDIHAAMEHARGFGYEPIGFNEDFPGWKEVFLHPKQAQGIVVQMAQSDPVPAEQEVDEAEWARRFPFPETPANPSPPATLAGLRLLARSEERARRQWQVLLGGEPREENGALVFRWPDSPLRLAVSFDPAAEEGPRALELAATRDLALPEGPHPVLGVAFATLRSGAF